MSFRVQTGDTEEIRVAFHNAAHAGVTGLSPTLRIQRVSDGQFWNGSAYQAGVANLAMTAVDATNFPGVYAYDFDTTSASEEEHRLRADAGVATVANRLAYGALHIGGFIDNLDAAVSSRNSVVPLAAATDQAEHDATQALIAALNDLDQAGVQAALTAQGYTAARAPGLDNLDAAVSSRAVPGDAMALVANALTAAAVATDAVDADALATNAVNEIRDAVLNALLGSGESLAVTLQNVARILGLDSSHTVTFTPSQVSVAPDGGGADVIVQSIGGNGETLTTVDRTT